MNDNAANIQWLSGDSIGEWIDEWMDGWMDG
jgi:hypothetical protein